MARVIGFEARWHVSHLVPKRSMCDISLLDNIPVLRVTRRSQPCAVLRYYSRKHHLYSTGIIHTAPSLPVFPSNVCCNAVTATFLLLGPIAKAGLDLSASSKASTHTLTSLCTFYILLQLSKHNKNSNKRSLKAIKKEASMLMTLKDLYGVYFIFN